MIFEAVTTTIFGAISLKAYLSKSGVGNDSRKLQKIFALSGLNVKDGNKTLTTQLLKKKNYDWGTEYRYRKAYGRCFDDYLSKKKVIESAINTRSVQVQLKDLRELKLDRDILANVKGIYTRKLTDRKEVELVDDGLLIIRVYNDPMPTKVDFQEGKGWEVVFGASRDRNKLILHDFEQVNHICFGGATRYGKSNLINCIINSLLRQQPNNVKFHLIDLKGGVELCDYENIKQTVSIAYEPEEALETLKNAYGKMRGKQEILKKAGKKKVEDAGITERHFVIIDEVGELNPDEAVDKKDIRKDGILIHKSEKTIKEECQKYMSQIARLGAGLGFRLILATQYPTGDVIPRQCKQNSDAKLCFRVQSGTASRVVLDGEGAESLPKIKGRAIYQMADKKVIVQTPLITPKIIQETITPFIIPNKGGPKVEKVERETRKNTLVIEETGLS